MIFSFGLYTCQICGDPFGAEIWLVALETEPKIRICSKCLVKTIGLDLEYKADMVKAMQDDLIRQGNKKWYKFWRWA